MAGSTTTPSSSPTDIISSSLAELSFPFLIGAFICSLTLHLGGSTSASTTVIRVCLKLSIIVDQLDKTKPARLDYRRISVRSRLYIDPSIDSEAQFQH